MLRRLLLFLIAAFVTLLVAFALLIASWSLAGLAGDEPAQTVLWWISITCLLLSGLCLVLMLTAAVLVLLSEPPTSPDRSNAE